MVLEVDPQRRRISLAIRSIMAALPASPVDLWENDIGGHFGARRSGRPRFPSRSWAHPITPTPGNLCKNQWPVTVI
jgi:hypothetical protein